jgi:hypothetical protein
LGISSAFVYRSFPFGETAEAAQLLEAEIGNMALMIKVLENNLILKKIQRWLL